MQLAVLPPTALGHICWSVDCVLFGEGIFFVVFFIVLTNCALQQQANVVRNRHGRVTMLTENTEARLLVTKSGLSAEDELLFRVKNTLGKT